MKNSRISIVIALLVALAMPSTSPASAVAVLPTITDGAWSTVTTPWGVSALAITPPTSNSTGLWTYVSLDTAVVSIVGSAFSINGVGSTIVVATQAATTDFLAATRNISVTVTGKAPTVGVFTVPSQTLNNPLFTLTPPTSTSAGVWSYTSSNVNIARISGSTLTLVGAGSATITATQAADWNWASTSKDAVITVLGATPVHGAFSNVSLTLGVFNSFTLSPPVSNSTGAWSYASSNLSVATVSGNSITPVGAGTAIITATQAATGNFGVGTSTMTLTVLGGAPTLGAFPNTVVALRPLSANTYTLTPPTSNSLGAWTFVSSDPSIVSISGNIATLYQVGSVTITANQGSAGNYGPSNPVTMRFTVSPATPTLSVWGNIDKTFGDAVFALTPPTSSSAGTWSYASSNTGVATVKDNQVTIVGAGQAIITATQAANWNWAETTTQLTLTVAPVAPTTGPLAAMTGVVGDPAIAITAPTSNSTARWTYTSSNDAVVVVSGSTLVIIGAGSATITATQIAGGNFFASVATTTTVKIFSRATVGAFDNKTGIFGGTAIAITAPTSASTGAWTYVSSDPTIVTVNAASLEIKKAGTVIITATQAATDTYVANTKTFAVTIDKATATVGTFDNKTGIIGGAAIAVTAPTSTSDGAWTYVSSDPAIVTVNAASLEVKKVGTVTISATQAATDSYLASTKTFTVTIGKATATVGAFENKAGLFGGAAIAITAATSTSDGAWSYASSDPAVVAVNGTSLEIKKAGLVTITAIQAATDSYVATTKTFTVTIGPALPILGAMPPIVTIFSTSPFVVNPPTSTSSGAWRFIISKTTIASVVDGRLVISMAGTTTITGMQAATADYLATEVTTTIEIKPYVLVKASKRVITVTVKGVTARVLIDGKTAKVGNNTVKAGTRVVTIVVGGKEIYRKAFVIK